MKKLLLLVMAALMLFSLVACAPAAEEEAAPAPEAEGEAAPAPEAEGEAAPATQYKIATVFKVEGIAWYERKKVGVEEFAAESGHDCWIMGPPEADAALQAQIVEDLIAQGVDGITIVPVSTEAMEPVLKKAREAGIAVIAHEGEGMVNVDWDMEAFKNEDYGAHFMMKLGELTGGEGEYIACVGSLTAASHNQWVDASIAYQEENFPNMSFYSDRIESAEDQEVAYEKMKEVLKANPNLVGFQGSGMSEVAGAALAVQEAGLSGKVHLVGTSLVSVSGKFIREGTIDMISFWDPAIAAKVMNKLAIMVIEGQEVTDGIDLGYEGYNACSVEGNVIKGQAWIDVTAENVDDPKYDF